jgi:hypothetical protein
MEVVRDKLSNHSPCCVMGDHGFDDGKDLLLLVAREVGDGF